MVTRDQLYNDAEDSLRIALDGRQSSIWTAMPGIVTAVDLATMTLSVQPSIQGQVTDFTGAVHFVNLPVLIHVPIQFPMAGGFALTLPVAVNDEVLVVFASRCIDSWWQNGGIGVPMEVRMHDLSDGFAIVGVKSQPNVLPAVSATTAQLRNQAGTTYIELDAAGNINLVSASGINVMGDLKVTGEVTAGTIPLKTHIHPGVTAGTGDTGAPIP